MIAEDAPSVLGDPNAPKLGHPTLIGGARARISGELRPPSAEGKAWELTNASGRYCKLHNRDEGMLKQAAALVQERGRAVLGDAFCVTPLWAERYGPERIQTSRDADREIQDLLADTRYDDDDRVNIVREWADIIVQERLTPDGALIEELVAMIITAPSEQPLVLRLHLVGRLLHHWPSQVARAQGLVPLVQAQIGLDAGKGPARLRLVLASLCVAFQEAGIAMFPALDIIADWIDVLPNALLTAIRNARRAAAGSPPTAPDGASGARDAGEAQALAPGSGCPKSGS